MADSVSLYLPVYMCRALSLQSIPVHAYALFCCMLCPLQKGLTSEQSRNLIFLSYSLLFKSPDVWDTHKPWTWGSVRCDLPFVRNVYDLVESFQRDPGKDKDFSFMQALFRICCMLNVGGLDTSQSHAGTVCL